MHNSFILQQYVYYTTILNMFRASPCSSLGGQIVSLQPLVSSLSVNSRTVCRLRAEHIHDVSKSMSQTFPRCSPPPLKQNVPINMGPKVNRFRDIDLPFMCWYPFWVLHKLFKVLIICRNTSVETSHHGFPDAFQLTWSVPDGIKCMHTLSYAKHYS